MILSGMVLVLFFSMRTPWIPWICWCLGAFPVGSPLINPPLSLRVSSPPLPTRYRAGTKMRMLDEWMNFPGFSSIFRDFPGFSMFDSFWFQVCLDLTWFHVDYEWTCHSGSDFWAWKPVEANELRPIRLRQRFTETHCARIYMVFASSLKHSLRSLALAITRHGLLLGDQE